MANQLDIAGILSLMEKALLAFINSRKTEVSEAAKGYFEDGKVRLTQLAQDMLSGDLSYKFGVARLKDEVVNITDQFLSIEQMELGAIQDAANKAVDIFRNAIDSAIPQG